MEIRKEVMAFAEAMEERLLANDHKGGWKDCNSWWLLDRLKQEVRELQELVHAIGKAATRDDHWGGRIREEAADVANFAMMIVDNLPAARPQREEEGR